MTAVRDLGDRPMCPGGCGRVRPARKVMCLRCWNRVPGPLQKAVYETWAAVNNGSILSAFPAYAKARREAIASLRHPATAP